MEPRELMELYFIRHGIAVDRSPGVREAERALTSSGRAKTRAIAKRLKALNVDFHRLLSSPLRRAQETAEILQQEGLATGVEIWDGLQPGQPLQDWLDWLITEKISPGQRVALVGHDPDLSSWAVQLLWGDIAGDVALGEAEPLQLKKAGILGLTLPDAPPFLGRGQLFWLTPPRFFLP